MRLDAISFDLFNTLVGIKPTENHLLVRVLEQQLCTLGFEEFHEAIIEKYVTALQYQFLDRQRTFKEFNNAELLQESIKVVTNTDIPLSSTERIITAYFEALNTYVFDDVPEALDRLSDNYPLYIISNHSWPNAAYNALSPIKKYFKKIIISGEVGWRKPSKKIFEPLIRRHGTRVVHCGDHGQEDIDAVYPLGWKAIWIKRSNKCPIPTVNTHVIATVQNLRELLEIIP